MRAVFARQNPVRIFPESFARGSPEGFKRRSRSRLPLRMLLPLLRWLRPFLQLHCLKNLSQEAPQRVPRAPQELPTYNEMLPAQTAERARAARVRVPKPRWLSLARLRLRMLLPLLRWLRPFLQMHCLKRLKLRMLLLLLRWLRPFPSVAALETLQPRPLPVP